MRRLAVSFVVALATSGAQAQETKPWGSRDFSAKRIGAASTGSIPKLVQIDPEEEPYHLTPARLPGDPVSAKPSSKTASGVSPFGQFWTFVSPDIASASPDRLGSALGHLSLDKRARGPKWKDLAPLVSSYGGHLSEKSQGTRVSPAFALAVMAVESGGRADVTSSAGAHGLMQLMPATAQRFGVTDSGDPEQNIHGGVSYLNFLLRAFGDDPILALAAYNAGEGSVATHGGVPPFKETRNYVPKVLEAWTVARMFCKIPPDRVTDPCAFNTSFGPDS